MITAKKLIGICICMISYSVNAQMFLFGFSPSKGIVGSTVTIDGSGFDLTPSNNAVFFGGTPAIVTSATATKLEVDVPAGISSNAVITVLNTVSGLQATLDKPFICTFNHGISSLLPASFQYVFQESSNFGPNLFGELVSDYSGKKMMSGDFDGDGKLDLLAMGTTVASSMYIYRNVNPSAGTKLDSSSFDTAVIIGLDANSVTTSCFPYDMDNDGKLDILIGRTNGFSIFINTSSGPGDIAFSKNTFSPTGTYSSQKCLAADLDFDGDLEVIAINPNGGSRISYYNNTGTPGSLNISVTATNIILPQSCGDFLLADLDDDDDKEIIVVTNDNTGSSANESIYYFENTNTSIGTISFSSTANLISGTLPAGNYNVNVPMAMADFDDDGNMDLVTASKGGLSDPSLIQVHKNLGFGSFTTLDVGSYYMSDGFTFMIRTGDINGDGRPDIVFHDGNSNGDLRAILNQYISGSLGSNHFTTYSSITATSLIPTGFVLDDFNQDGQLDIIANELGTSNLHYLSNGTAIFYAKAVAYDSLNLTTSWSSAEDGTGTMPPDFSAGTFFLNNSSNTPEFNTGGDWNMGGALVVPAGKKLFIKDSSQLNLTGSIDNIGYINGGIASTLAINAPDIVKIAGKMSLNHLTLGPTSGELYLSGLDTIAGNMTIDTGKSLRLDSTCRLVFTGNINNQGTINAFDGNTFLLNAGSAQIIDGINSFYDLEINTAAGITFTSADTVRGTLTMTYGNLTLFDDNLTVGLVAGGNSTSYIKTSGNGSLRCLLNDSSILMFTVGNSAYNPVRIHNNSGAPDFFEVKIADEVFSNGTSGDVVLDKHIMRTWFIEKENPNGGAGVNFEFHWNAGEESDTILTPVLNHYNDTAWEIPTAVLTSASPTSLYFEGYMGGFSPFAIGAGLTPLPIKLFELKAIPDHQSKIAKVTWKTNGDFKGQYKVMKSMDGKEWQCIATVMANWNPESIQNYEIIDRLPYSFTFYKVVEVSESGKMETSGTVTVNFNSEIKGLTQLLGPNPSIGSFKLIVNEPVHYILSDINGRILSEGEIDDIKVFDQISPGIYLLNIFNDNLQESKRVIVN